MAWTIVSSIIKAVFKSIIGEIVKKQNNSFVLPIAGFLLVCIGLACGGSATETSTNSGSVAVNGGMPDPADRTVIHQPKDIAGTYSVTGSNVDGAGIYDGILNVTKRDAVYQFSWSSGAKTYDGVGVQTRDTIAVAFTEGADGKGCGVVLYDIAANGDLSGKAGYWGVNEAETENAKRTSGTDLVGKYNVSGTNSGGGDYKGSLEVKMDGEGYAFEWNTGSIEKGFGIRQGNTANIGLGGDKCGFVSYEVKPDGTLEGKWGGQGTKSFGTETAKKK